MSERNNSEENPTQDNYGIPKELNVFCRSLYSFIPPGKTWASLTNEEKELVKLQYRFSPYRPGINQSISGNGLDF